MESAYPFILLLLICLYLLPVIVAITRHHTNCVGIGILNVLLGWTLLGWVGALVWSFSSQPATPEAATDGPAAAKPAPEKDGVENFAASSSELKDCPFCAEPIRVAAIKCKHCGSDLTAVALPA